MQEPAAGHATEARDEGGASPPGERAASVVIPVRDRRDELAIALASVERQACRDPRGVEVVVLDDASSDGTWDYLQEVAATGGLDLQPIRRDTPCGPGGGRNAAAVHARGEVLVFLDSDCVACEGWLDALLAPLADPAVGIVGGAEVPDPDEPLFARVVDFVMTSLLTTGGVRGRDGAKAGRYRPRTFSMAIRRSLFEELGGFRALYRGEDLDLSERAAQRGARLVFAPDAKIHHHRRKTPAAFLRQLFQNGRGRGTVIRLDRRNAEPIYFLPLLLVLAALGILFVALGAAPSSSARTLAASALWIGGLYLGAVGVTAAWSLGSIGALALAPLAFVLQQGGYAVGLIAGLVQPYSHEPS